MSLGTLLRRRADPAAATAPTRRRRAVTWVVTGLAGLFVLLVLVAPADFDRFTVGEFARVPLEGLVGVVVLLVLPPRARRVVALVGGVLLGVLTVVKLMDIGFDAVLYRPFDLVLDWPLLGPAVDYVKVTVGTAGEIAAIVLTALLVIGVVVLTTRSVLRLADVVGRHRLAATRAVALAAIAALTWVFPGVPVVSSNAVSLAVDHTKQVGVGLHDKEAFAAESAVDAYRDTPGSQLLTGLRGKDVVIAFVESYGRDAVEDPELAPVVDAALDRGTRTLKEAGYSSRSGWLTSPTAGGGSWLAQATLLSGLWIDNQQRYRTLMASDRLTLNDAFRRADWRSVGVVPGITQAWPEGEFFGYDPVYAAADLGYRGPRFGYATMPDQYTLSAFQKAERSKPGHAPVMASIPLLSSHAPWSPIPRGIDWDDVGDGSVYNTMESGNQAPESIFGRDPKGVRADYARSVEYSVDTLVSYVKTYGDDNLVLVFLGDHQPAQIVTGEGAGHDVPITVVAHDPAVLDRVSSWGWNDGIKPAPEAPVWPMSDFRDKFLTAFGTPPTVAAVSP
ncbi:sulfatase [Umezawaea tangerina]|uniref:Phosphoglycerol transferase MdoB-like AlkP superfamily enzyme n=1 Tax=Umezawaea tangerina TaxID=84725 RepID=A0A2T0SP28_9PSEU|nr:sulfatase [Umezawaea tangerina]PRY35146.1 phosphoglycerol transferase MdoB-like AlkP superfamily enzyme [Umezawaea tangerina]